MSYKTRASCFHCLHANVNVNDVFWRRKSPPNGPPHFFPQFVLQAQRGSANEQRHNFPTYQITTILTHSYDFYKFRSTSIPGPRSIPLRRSTVELSVLDLGPSVTDIPIRPYHTTPPTRLYQANPPNPRPQCHPKSKMPRPKRRPRSTTRPSA